MSEENKQYIYGNLWIFEVKLNKGEMKKSHKHEFDHLHQVLKGSAIVKVALSCGKALFEKEVTEGQYIRVPRDYYHSIEALEDYLGNCIHAVRDTNNEVVETDFIRGITEDELIFEPNKG